METVETSQWKGIEKTERIMASNTAREGEDRDVHYKRRGMS
jgi:hypothetical protein